MRSTVIVAALALMACRAPRPAYVAVRGGEVAARLPELRRDGEAQIATVVIAPGAKETKGDVETVFLFQSVKVGGKPTSIDRLAAGCPPDDGACELARHTSTAIWLRDLPAEPRAKARHVNLAAIVLGGLTLASVGGMAYCISECESDKGFKSMGLGVGGLLFGMLTYVALGGHIHE